MKKVQIHENITCGKCGATVSGIYCPMCGAKLRDMSEYLYSRLSREGRKWAREKKDFYVALPCFELAREISWRKHPEQLSKHNFTKADAEAIMARAERFYALLSNPAAVEMENA